jgi:anti-sigma B factor antagonist
VKLHDLAILEEAHEGEVRVIELRGEVDRSSALGVERRMVAAADAGARGVVLDLSMVRDIDRPMLSALLAGARHIAHHRGRLVLVCGQPGLRRILRITGVDHVIDVTTTRAAAMQTVRRG